MGRNKRSGTGNVNRNHKDTVFRKLFSKKEALLSLYNALQGTEYTNPEDLEVTTLENAIYIKMKNDISFVFQSQLHLVEHQSSPNPNIPLRDLFYVSDVLKRITRDRNLYSSRPEKIPTPVFIVFYNGKEEQPERKELKLSDLFEIPVEEPGLELKVTQININPGYNEELLSRCPELSGYASLIAKIRRNIEEGKNIQEAVPDAVDECIKEGILTDFLRAEKSEVYAMTIYEFDEEQYKRDLIEEGRAAGKEEGRQEGRAEERANTEKAIKRAEAAEELLARYKRKYGELE